MNGVSTSNIMITAEKWQKLREKMRSLRIDEKDIIEKFILGSGSGGQKINKTSSCVWLKHIPSGIIIKCQQERSREMNRFIARRLLSEKIDFAKNKKKSEKQQLIAKIRRQKRSRSKKAREKMLENKKIRSNRKKNRKRVDE